MIARRGPSNPPRRRSSAGAVAPVGRPRPRPSAGIPEADRHAIQSAIAEWDGRPTAPLSLSPTTDNEGSLSKPRPFGTPPVPPAGLALPTAARPSPAPTALPRRRPHLGHTDLFPPPALRERRHRSLARKLVAMRRGAAIRLR
jgi:hypothetical protein